MLDYYDAIAYISPSITAPDLNGTVKFLGADDGTWVEAEIFGLPNTSANSANNTNSQIPDSDFFGFHIHENSICGEQFTDEPFLAAGGHYNPTDESHPKHAGDLPSLISSDGTSKMLFFTNRFNPEDIIDRTVVIHQMPDDFSTQPSGNSGKRIGCGVIKPSGLHMSGKYK